MLFITYLEIYNGKVLFKLLIQFIITSWTNQFVQLCKLKGVQQNVNKPSGNAALKLFKKNNEIRQF